MKLSRLLCALPAPAAFIHILSTFNSFAQGRLGELSTYIQAPDRAPCHKLAQIVVVGAGVVGLSTALELAGKTSACIYVVDSSEVFNGASGQATGCLHYGDFHDKVQNLSEFSWHKHQQYNEIYGGQRRYGFSSSLEAYTITGKGSPTVVNDDPGIELPPWLKDRGHYSARREPYNTAAGSLDPYRFGQTLAQECKARGVTILLNTTVTKILPAGSSGGAVLQLSDQSSLEAGTLVIAAGAWSGKVLAEHFPTASLRIEMDTSTSSSNYLILRTPRWQPSDDQKGCVQVFMDKVVGQSLEVMSRLGGWLFVGYTAEAEDLPELATEVKPQMEVIEDLQNISRHIFDIPEDGEPEFVRVGRAYRPFIKGREELPLIAKIPLPLLSDSLFVNFSVYINTGHGSGGITLGPGSGAVLTELIMGWKLSADISGLGL